HDSEFFAGLKKIVPNHRPRSFVGGDVNLEAILAGVASTGNQNIGQTANRAASEPVKLHSAQIGIGQLLQHAIAVWTLHSNLGEVVAEVFNEAIEVAGILADPVVVFLARTRVNDQQVIEFRQAVHDDIVNKSALRIKHGRVLGLANGKAGGVVHSDVLNGEKGLRADQANVAHVAHIEEANAVSDRIVLGDDAAAGGILDGHVPAVEFDHLGAHLAVDGMERGLADGGRGRLNCGQ